MLYVTASKAVFNNYKVLVIVMLAAPNIDIEDD